MPASEQSLADEALALKRLLLQREAELLEARLMVEKLKLEIARYKRQKFGASSERLTQLAQLELLVEELESEQARIQEPVEPDAVACKAEPTRPARKALPPHLPRETLVHEPAAMAGCACLECGGTLRVLGEDVAEMLEIVPARFKVIRHVRPKYSCAKCQAIVQAAAPSRPIARGLAGPGLLAHILVSKFADHLPLYLEYLAQLPEDEAIAGLKDVAPILGLLSARLQQRESRYAALFELLLKLADTRVDSQKVAEKL